VSRPLAERMSLQGAHGWNIGQGADREARFLVRCLQLERGLVY